MASGILEAQELVLTDFLHEGLYPETSYSQSFIIHTQKDSKNIKILIPRIRVGSTIKPCGMIFSCSQPRVA